MVKTVKLYLIPQQVDKDRAIIGRDKVDEILKDLQNQTREIKNKSIQFCWEYYNFESDYVAAKGIKPDNYEIFGRKSIDGYIYDLTKKDYELYSGNLSTTIRTACTEFKNACSTIKSGETSLISYGNNQPIALHDKAIKLSENDDKYYVELSLFNKAKKEELNFDNCSLRFKITVRDNSTKTILDRCLNGSYKAAESELSYDKRKREWMLLLSFKFEPERIANLDKDKILGVDLGLSCPICASVYGDKSRFVIQPHEIENFRKNVEVRKKQLLKQGAYCGDGRIGHGTKTRNKPAYDIRDKIARFRDTTNHKYSRALIEYAVKNGCGTIQMEDLTGISDNKDRFLKDWTYYDLQTKIEYKAKELGIDVIKIKPKNTSRRCSKCGFIDKGNRLDQSHFECLNCGYKENADYNASQNIAIKDIDKIIAKESKSNAKHK
ncbi:MAG: IS200/IS605 family element transposase accessory protein TnpB [Clostridiales bacterium]|nr:IS200/IS605 family element transposase accessory protein TnpB [Clostridiales bacterium]